MKIMTMAIDGDCHRGECRCVSLSMCLDICRGAPYKATCYDQPVLHSVGNMSCRGSVLFCWV